MHNAQWLTFIAVFLLASCVSRQERDDMQARLAQMAQWNTDDTVFTARHTAEAQTLADWFDRHGTPNEQLKAHYLLGRTYADRGEAPHALDCYQTAISHADTTSQDCDYRTLCRVYAQMADLFYKQNLMEECLCNINKSIHYSEKAGDSIVSLNERAMKMSVYNRCQMPDSTISTFKKIYDRYLSMGFEKTGAAYSGLVIKSLIKKGYLDTARHYIDIYESRSGYFNTKHEIEKGRETYYNTKALFFMSQHKYDSAEYYYRKELRLGHDFNNQNMASYGLAVLFQKTSRPDSAAKYALYSYAMNDSVYAHMATSEVERMQALYGYTSYKQEAQRAEGRARIERSKRIAVMIAVSVIAVLFLLLYLFRRREYQKRYDGIIKSLEKANDEILHLRSHESVLNHIIDENSRKLNSQEKELLHLADYSTEKEQLGKTISERESEIERLKSDLEKYRKREKLTKKSVDKELNQSKVYRELRVAANRGRHITDEEWHEVMQLVIRLLPGFHNLVSAKERDLSLIEYKICVCERLGIEPRRISYLIGVSESYVSRLRDGLCRKIFGSDGSRADFNSKISQIY